MLKKVNRFIFYCFYAIVFFNKKDNPINRACFGMAIFYALLLTITFFSLSIVLGDFNTNPFIASFLFLVIYALAYFKLKNHFSMKLTQIQLEFEGLASRKTYVFLGLLFFAGPFVLLGIVGHRYSHLKKETTIIQRLSSTNSKQSTPV